MVNYLQTKLEEEIAKVISEETKNFFANGYLLTKVLNDDEEKDRFEFFFFDDLNPEHEVLFILVRKDYCPHSVDMDIGFTSNFNECNIYLGSVSRKDLEFIDAYLLAENHQNKKELIKQFYTRKEYFFNLDMEMDEETTVLSLEELLELHIDYMKGRLKRVFTPPRKS